MRLPRLPVLLAAAAAAVAAGCGEGGPLTHAELVQRANAACTRAVATITATGAPRDLAELGRIGGHQVDLANDQVSKIAGLHPPDADRAAHRRLVDALRRAIDADRRVVGDARSGRRPSPGRRRRGRRRRPHAGPQRGQDARRGRLRQGPAGLISRRRPAAAG